MAHALTGRVLWKVWSEFIENIDYFGFVLPKRPSFTLGEFGACVGAAASLPFSSRFGALWRLYCRPPVLVRTDAIFWRPPRWFVPRSIGRRITCARRRCVGVGGQV